MSFSEEQINLLIDNKLNEQKAIFNNLLDEQEKRFKKQIDELTIKLKKVDEQDKKTKKLSEQVKDISKKIEVMENDLVIISKELEEVKRLAYSTDQYQRRNNIEISGLPHDCDDNLEEVCVNLINSIIFEPGHVEEDKIGTFDIEGCHRLKTTNKDGTKDTIIRFMNRKVCEDIMYNKKKVKDVKLDDLGDEVNNIYFNANLNKYYKELSAKCRRLKKKRKISDTWISNGTVRIKLKDNTIRVITH